MTKQRLEYLTEVSEDYDVPLNIVLQVAELLGEGEDYDGLISMLQDYIND